ncbi:hypothetical protein A3F66_02415 [candidate division TM6 bacterium RIFCSPHIGHO2_12_FULL_32_22]|nr:MAG: hypothetical protein A3F66_02415 [candidate division TM6 bacterium RIFCSPHIGHO2_12_FULL_32_22]
MGETSRSQIISVGLAIFSMLFGAGNLMFPIAVGMMSGDLNFFGLSGFLLTAVILPITGIVAMILFDGDYKSFFYRLGDLPGFLIILACMLIIGPIIAIPRIVTLSHIMISPFIPEISSLVFALIFLGVTFLLTFRENKIMDLLGKFISPVLLISLMIIIVKGFIYAGDPLKASDTALNLFIKNIQFGYGTMDLFGGIFFASIVLTILKENLGHVTDVKSLKKLAIIGFKAGLLGTFLLGLIYVGLSYLGVYYGFGLENANAGEIFRDVSIRILGSYGALVIAIAVLFACLSTSIALYAVVGEYLQKEVFRNKIKFVPSLIILSLLCLPLSMYGLDYVLALTAGPILYIGYPVLIAITFLNIAYKWFDFKPIKIPVLVVTIAMVLKYFFM